MNYSEKVEWLSRYRAALKKEKLLRDELQALRERAAGCGKAFDGVPGAASDGQSLPRAVESIIKAQQELECQINVCGAIRREVVAAIETVPDDRDQEILRRRYLLGETFEQISAKMLLEYRWVRRRHKAGVNKFNI